MILIIAATSLLVPDTVLGVAAGVLFGLAEGTVVMAVGVVLTASVNYLAGVYQRVTRPQFCWPCVLL